MRHCKNYPSGGKGCIAGQTICLVDCFGEVHPCSYMAASAGNVKTTPFKEIWERSPLFLELRDFDRYKGRCGACEYLCPARPLGEQQQFHLQVAGRGLAQVVEQPGVSGDALVQHQ